MPGSADVDRYHMAVGAQNLTAPIDDGEVRAVRANTGAGGIAVATYVKGRRGHILTTVAGNRASRFQRASTSSVITGRARVLCLVVAQIACNEQQGDRSAEHGGGEARHRRAPLATCVPRYLPL